MHDGSDLPQRERALDLEVTRPSSRKDASGTGLQATRAERDAAADLLETESTEEVRNESFSWISTKSLIESRNDQFAKHIFDPVPDERARWMDAQRAAGIERRFPGLIVDRTDLEHQEFLIVGDPGEGDESQQAVARAVSDPEIQGDFMVILSDVIYPGGDVNDYIKKFYDPFEEYAKVIYGLPGNHDWYDGLEGFMFHFCGAEPLPRVDYRWSSNTFGEWLSRALWRRSSRPRRNEIFSRRAERPPWTRGALARPSNVPPQPGPYYAIELRDVMLVAIDTGITGTIDSEQGRWLLATSKECPKPKVLLTGKPLVVNSMHKPCEIEWDEGSAGTSAWPTVDAIVRDPDFGYVAAIGGDIHNYQRYELPKPGSDSNLQYVVSGGGGAYMSATHTVPLASGLELEGGTNPVPAGVSEDDLRLYPLRGDSLALFADDVLIKRNTIAEMVVVILFFGIISSVIFFVTNGWGLTAGAALMMNVAAAQFFYGQILDEGQTDRTTRLEGSSGNRVSRPARSAGAALGLSSPHPVSKKVRFKRYGLLMGLLAALMLLLGHLADDLGNDSTELILTGAAVLVPLSIVAIDWKSRRFAMLAGGLIFLGLFSRLVSEDAFTEALRVAGIALLLLLIPVALAFLRHDEAKDAVRDKALPVGLGLVFLAGLCAAFILGAHYSQVVAVVLALLLGLFVGYLIWIRAYHLCRPGMKAKAEELGEALADQAALFVARRLGVEPVRQIEFDEVDPLLKPLFDLIHPPADSWRARFSPVHHLIPEIFDINRPPMAKNFLRLSVSGPEGARKLAIRCHEVTGDPVGQSVPGDLVEIDLQ